jgi:hypothetical protein
MRRNLPRSGRGIFASFDRIEIFLLAAFVFAEIKPFHLD